MIDKIFSIEHRTYDSIRDMDKLLSTQNLPGSGAYGNDEDQKLTDEISYVSVRNERRYRL